MIDIQWLHREKVKRAKTRFRFAESLAPPAKGSLRPLSPPVDSPAFGARASRSIFLVPSGLVFCVNCLESSLRGISCASGERLAMLAFRLRQTRAHASRSIFLAPSALVFCVNSLESSL